MDFYVGTSGFSYKPWKGIFYPTDLPDKDMLSFYGKKLNAVEINNTFYRLPKSTILESWTRQVPENFKFSIKATQSITHIKRLKDTDDETTYFVKTVQTLNKRLGVVLFQLPPNIKKDISRLEKFIQLLPEKFPATFEFRNNSWFDDEVFSLLRSHNFALTLTETDEAPQADFISTANWAYLRLRRSGYTIDELQDRIKKIHEKKWDQTFVFFKHEDKAIGPQLARQFNEMINK